jgi:hypothetical protein
MGARPWCPIGLGETEKEIIKTLEMKMKNNEDNIIEKF